MRSQAKARLAIIGPSGCGKTQTGLFIADQIQKQIDPTKPFAGIDSEHGSMSLYAPMFRKENGDPGFRTYPMSEPYSPEHYNAAIHKAQHAGASVLFIDSISHEWFGMGGVQTIVDEAQARMGGNKWGAWAVGTPKHNLFLETLLGCNMHLVVTMRAKSEWIQVDGKPKKVGLGPVQREGIEYEFQAALLQHLDHSVTVDKSRLGETLPVGAHIELDEKTTRQMADSIWTWLNEGEPVKAQEPKPDPKPEPKPDAGENGEGKPEEAAAAVETIKPATKGKITKAIGGLQSKHADWNDGTEWEEVLKTKLPDLPWNTRKAATIDDPAEAEAAQLLTTIAETDKKITEAKLQAETQKEATLT